MKSFNIIQIYSPKSFNIIQKYSQPNWLEDFGRKENGIKLLMMTLSEKEVGDKALA